MKGPLDIHFNVAVLHIANHLFPCGFDVSDNAPDTYEKLCAILDAGKRMVVWSGGSEATIYCSPEVNYAFPRLARLVPLERQTRLLTSRRASSVRNAVRASHRTLRHLRPDGPLASNSVRRGHWAAPLLRQARTFPGWSTRFH